MKALGWNHYFWLLFIGFILNLIVVGLESYLAYNPNTYLQNGSSSPHYSYIIATLVISSFIALSFALIIVFLIANRNSQRVRDIFKTSNVNLY